MDPLINVEFFTNSKDFNIRNGRFRTIAGDSYTNCYPPPVSPVRERPPINTIKTTFFSNSSNFEIGGGEFLVINGDSVDFSPPFGVPGNRLDDGYYDPGFSSSVPQSIGPQFNLDLPEDWPSPEQPEDIEQATNVLDYTQEGQMTDNMAPPGVDIAQAANDVDESSGSPPRTIHPDNAVQWNVSQGQTFQDINPPADVGVEPELVSSLISHRTTPTQPDTSPPVLIGEEGTSVASLQGGENYLRAAEPYSLSEDVDHPNASPRTLSTHLGINGNEVHSPEEIRINETDPPSKTRRLLNRMRNILTGLWNHLPFVSGSSETRT